jgi:F-type H+-transporting ATPase subunit b
MRRSRTSSRLAAGALLALLFVVGGASAAFAADKPTEEAECVAKAVHANEAKAEASGDFADFNAAVTDCAKAPNPLLPATNEIVWGSIGFIVVFVFLAKFGFPAVKDGMNARAERIRNSLDEAERTKTEAQTILDEYQRQLADAKNEAARIVDEARQAADAMRRDLMSKAEAEAQATRERAQADIQTQVERATADLRAQVAQLSVDAAEMVVKNQLTDRDAQLRLVEDYIAQVGTQN